MKPKKQKLNDGLYRVCCNELCQKLFPIADQDCKEQFCWSCYRKVQWSGHYLAHHLTAPTYKPDIYPCEDLDDNLILGPCKVAGGEPPMKKVSQEENVLPMVKETNKRKTKKKVYYRVCSEIGCENEFVIKNNRQVRCESCTKEITRQKRLAKALEKQLSKTTLPIDDL